LEDFIIVEPSKANGRVIGDGRAKLYPGRTSRREVSSPRASPRWSHCTRGNKIIQLLAVVAFRLLEGLFQNTVQLAFC
jgi:hypothetical protein